ncbi:MAG: hypothetical protein U0235_11170 [Polyangiaceae bacterium]
MRALVALTPEEREEHDRERALYREFVSMNHIRMSSPRGFGEFVMLSSRSEVAGAARCAPIGGNASRVRGERG